LGKSEHEEPDQKHNQQEKNGKHKEALDSQIDDLELGELNDLMEELADS